MATQYDAPQSRNGSEIHTVGPFILGKTLGTGTTGKVKLAFHQETGFKVAIKIIHKDYLTSRISMLKKVEREIAVMKLLDHPHVLKLYDVYETSRYLFLVLEYIEGGELFDYLVKKGRLDQREALLTFQQIISGVDFCHQHLICHRDLKPENILLDGDKNIKIADFGMASMMKEGSLLATSCGSPHYASPEVVMGAKYRGTAADVWSCGVILFALLTGKLPFDDDNIRRLLSKVKSGIFSMPQFLPKEAKDLLWKMLTVDPKERITMAQVKAHSWFRSNHIQSPTVLHVSERTADSIVDSSQIDVEILRSLVSLGVGDENEIQRRLLDPENNLLQVYYQLLVQRKLKPVEALMQSSRSKSLGNRGRGSSAPMLVESLPPSSASPSSPPSSPIALPHTPGPRSRPRKMGLLEQQRRNSSTTPVAIMATSNRFQRLKMEDSAPPSPIIGSSPKKSWFTSFFAKADKDQPPQGILSTKSLIEITSELQRVLTEQHATWEMENNQTLHVKMKQPRVGMVIEIMKAEAEGAQFITFTQQSGTPDDYDHVIATLHKELVL